MEYETEEFLPVVSAFSGAGGLDTGFIKAGFTPILAVDGDAAACDTFYRNHPTVPVIKKDLSQVSADFLVERVSELPGELRPVGLIGGPPCQAFSLSNGHKKAGDPRAELSKHYAALLSKLNQEFEIDFFVFENVLGLSHTMHADQLALFRRLFDAAGFWIFNGELNAYDFGVPQVRHRLFIVGFNKRKYPRIEFEFPSGIRGGIRTVRQAIGHFPKPTYFNKSHEFEELPFHPNHWCMTPRSSRFRDGSLKDEQIKGRAFRVLGWDEPSWTVAYGHREVHIHPRGSRRLSVYEAMRLQGFPGDYELCGTLSDQFRLVSDAVPPALGTALGRAILDALRSYRRTHKELRRRPDPSHEVYWKACYSSAHVQPPPFLQGFFLKYAKKHYRHLPWRRPKVSPFAFLIAEFLLKQTKAEDVARVWPELVRRFPSAERLNKAPKRELLNILRPLGLQNQRAASLRNLSRALLVNFDGNVPSETELLLSLPGVGLYTAAAVRCFKFGKRAPIVDANVLRILARITGIDYGSDLRRSEGAWALAWALLPRCDCDKHNYGILDFAARVCNTTPDCGLCPLRRNCAFGISRAKVGKKSTLPTARSS
jgi:DNA (cytosine-5)-methyltransferase 1